MHALNLSTQKKKTTRSIGVLVVLVALCSTFAVAAQAQRGHSKGTLSKTTQIHDLSFELVAQAINSAAGVTPATSIQYGYLSTLHGQPIFNSGPQNETTALFTFYVETTTTRVISDGPLRVVNREGSMTVYQDPSANGSFSNPDSFRDGTPVLVAGLTQQGIVDTVTGAFTLRSLCTVLSSSPFSNGAGQVQLGSSGDRFTAVFNGHLNSLPTPPTGYLAGYTFSTSDHR